MSKSWTHYTDWLDLPGNFRYKACRFVDFNATWDGRYADFADICLRERISVTEEVLESFEIACYDMWGVVLDYASADASHVGF